MDLKKTMKISGSWLYVENDFKNEFEKLQFGNMLREDGPGECIWRTRNKIVLKLSTAGGEVVYKTYLRIRKFPYLFRPSPLGSEALNYVWLKDLGFPLPQLLAAGEYRAGFILHNCFLISEFAADTENGRWFLENDQPQLRDEFIRQSMEILKKMHTMNIAHGGFTPANVLWKGETAADLELCLIDVATCQKSGIFGRQKAYFKDFFDFFRFFDFTDEELNRYLQYYFDAPGKNFLVQESLFDELKKRLQHGRKK